MFDLSTTRALDLSHAAGPISIVHEYVEESAYAGGFVGFMTREEMCKDVIQYAANGGPISLQEVANIIETVDHVN